MPTRNYQSIGEVLVSVKAEFPDITISKIRFLESEGLIDPERTPSGYRKFYDKDVERLKSILRMQRDEYLPLKVIKDRLLQLEGGDGRQVWAPAGCARGFAVLSEHAEIEYLCTGTYNAAAESGIRWDDPEIAIEWPVAAPSLSAKDGAAPSLREWLARPESDRFRLGPGGEA